MDHHCRHRSSSSSLGNNNIDPLFDDDCFPRNSHSPPPKPRDEPLLLLAPDPCVMPSFPPINPPSPLDEQLQPLRSHRGRKSRFSYLPEPQRKAVCRAIRAEKNRKCARESRVRKQQYVEGLESEVAALKSELAECKRKLARYELIERQRDEGDAEDQHVFEAAKQEMEQTKADSRQFPDIFMKKMEEKLEQRGRALEQLARLTVEIAIPLSIRGFLWSAEDKITGPPSPDLLQRIFGTRPEPEDAKNIIGCMRTRFPDVKGYLVQRARVGRVLKSIRRNVKLMLKCQRRIQFETLRTWKWLTDDYLPKRLSGKVENSVVFHQKLKQRKELKDDSFFGVGEKDFTFDTLEAVRVILGALGNDMGLEDGEANDASESSSAGESKMQ